MRSSRFLYFSIILLYLSLHFSGLSFLFIGNTVQIAPWDFLLIIIFILWVVAVCRGKIFISQSFLLSIFFVFLFTVWIGIEAFRSPDPIRGLTMFLIMIRNFLLFIVIGSLTGQVKQLYPLHRTLFLISGGIAFLSIILFLSSSHQFISIAANPLAWRPGIGYVLDQGGILRLVGFAEDPNFYSIFAALALLIGFSLRGHPVTWVCICLIGISLILANSRSFFICFVFSTIVVWFIGLFKNMGRTKRYYKFLLTSILAILAVGSIWTYFYQVNLLEKLLRRFSLVEQSGRFELWQAIWNNGFDHILIGKGLREAEVILNGMYSHNSYLDLIVETGLIGFGLWLGIVMIVSWKGIHKVNQLEVIPWFHMWILLLAMMFAFSFVYNPFFWLIAGILASDYGHLKSSNKEEKYGDTVRFRYRTGTK